MLDYFYAGRLVPDYEQPADLPKDYLRYLVDRQLDSMGLRAYPQK